MKTTTKKGVMINLDSNVIQILKNLAEKNSSSMSQVVRRLIIDEERRGNEVQTKRRNNQ
jgi:macrodomain Ter protein organizer (MatP/YcbG family)